MIQKVGIFIAGLAAAGGLWMLGVSAKYGFLFLSEPHNASRHEYLQGVVLAGIFAVPFWLVASVAIWLVGSQVNRKFRLAVNAVTISLCVLVLAFTVIPVVFVALGAG
jgi:hypothetical protein